ncbi:hypothetical protein ASE23_06830 [Rhizobium sp. Root73]|uniref:3TM-type holin n=1 Tax=unclassified Rhizobium TaxID=2613769 RepID=UPI000713FC9B|nr:MULTISPECIES: 3TM-type holin [unclassified Rhizobium]KQV31203.1 hypothetical protein ASC96_08420 [Rhizobium sp. Root1204]KQY10850.1 hypothetical protein ASD36_09065 [Rhizobium sp. Root1334]KRC04835.1 hypothetical protein ASE23_06830 [Rhizobium sp. Root73]
MSAILTSILIDVAAKVGAPLVKRILQEKVGGVAGDLGGTVIDAIATRAGVPPEELPSLPAPRIEAAVAAVEAETPELVLAYNDRQRMANELMLAEMNKETGFGWLWRPAGMWLMLACVAWYVVLRPLVNATLAALGSRVAVDLGIDMPTFLTIFMTYSGLYMGGNTVIRAVKKDG